MTEDDKALVGRLRDGVLYGDARLHNPKGHDPLRMEAADRIEQLEREKAVVSDLWEQQKEIALDYLADCNKAADRIKELEEALRDAIRAMDLLNQPDDYRMMWLYEATETARKALGGTND